MSKRAGQVLIASRELDGERALLDIGAGVVVVVSEQNFILLEQEGRCARLEQFRQPIAVPDSTSPNPDHD